MAIHDMGRVAGGEGDVWSLESVSCTTRQLYDRIYNALGRRCQLITGKQSDILRVPFEDLRLDRDGYLESWYRQYMSELPDSFKRYVPQAYRNDGFTGAYGRYNDRRSEFLARTRPHANGLSIVEKDRTDRRARARAAAGRLDHRNKAFSDRGSTTHRIGRSLEIMAHD